VIPRLAATVLALILCLAATTALAQKTPDPIVHSKKVLLESKQLVLKRDPLVMPAYRALIEEANRALTRASESVVFKPAAPPRGKPHDYWSLAPDFWPDPTEPDGLPYVQREGESNPEATSAKFDHARLHQTAEDALTLALAWYLSDNEQYAGKGAALIFSWCCDSYTRMTPNMNFARMRPGAKPGKWEASPEGLIEGRDLILLAEAARMLEPSRAWGNAVTKKLKRWFEDYIQWMQTSELGIEASGLTDRHGTWYDAQMAVFAAFTGQDDLARSVVDGAAFARMIPQISDNGAMPLELERVRSRHATFSNLSAFFILAAVGEKVGVDLWNRVEDGVSVKLALDYAAPYLAADETWPFGSVGQYDHFMFTTLLHRAAMVYKDERYRDFLKKLPADKLAQDRAQLFY